MWHVLQFLKWKASVWDMCADFLPHDLSMAERTTNELLGSSHLLASRMEGSQVYARHQAHVQQELYHHCRNLWHEVPLLVISQVCWDQDLVALDPFIVKELSLQHHS
jgi:hypothetical protein